MTEKVKTTTVKPGFKIDGIAALYKGEAVLERKFDVLEFNDTMEASIVWHFEVEGLNKKPKEEKP